MKTPKLGAQSLAGAARDRQRGFSLMELMIVVAISFILSGFAVPMVQSALRNYTVNSAATNIARLTQLARYAAINNGSPACTRLAGGRFGVDANCNGTLDSTESQYALPAGVSMTNTGPGSTTGMNFSSAPTATTSPFVITFNSRGGTSVSPTVSVIYVRGVTTLYGAVTISGVGRARAWRYSGARWF